MIDFEEFVLEYEPRCSYDYLEMFELIERPSGARTVRNNPNKVNARNPVYENLMANNDRQLVEDEDFQYLQKQFLATHEHPESSYESTNIFQPSNQTYNSNIPPPTQ